MMTTSYQYSDPITGQEENITDDNIQTAFYWAKSTKDDSARKKAMEQCMGFINKKLQELDAKFGNGEEVKKQLNDARVDVKTKKDAVQALTLDKGSTETTLASFKMQVATKTNSRTQINTQLQQAETLLLSLKNKMQHPNQTSSQSDRNKDNHDKQSEVVRKLKESLEEVENEIKKLEEDITATQALLDKKQEDLTKENVALDELKKLLEDISKKFKECHPLMGQLNDLRESRPTLRTLAQSYDHDSSKVRNDNAAGLCTKLGEELTLTKAFTAAVYGFLANSKATELGSAEFRQQDALAKALTLQAESLAYAGLAVDATLARYNALLRECNKRKFTACTPDRSPYLYQPISESCFSWSYENINLVASQSFESTEVQDEYCVALPLPQQTSSEITTVDQLITLLDNDDSPMPASAQFSFEEQKDFPEALMWHLKGTSLLPSRGLQVPQKGLLVLNADPANMGKKKCRSIVAYHFDPSNAVDGTALLQFWTKLFQAADRAKSHTLCVPFSSADALMQNKSSTEFFEQLWQAAKQHSGTSLRKVCVIVPDANQWARFVSYAQYRASADKSSPHSQTETNRRQTKGLSKVIREKSSQIQGPGTQALTHIETGGDRKKNAIPSSLMPSSDTKNYPAAFATNLFTTDNK